MGTVAVAGRWWTWEQPLWCVLRCCACQSAPGTAGPPKGRAVAGAEEGSKNQGTDRTDTRDALRWLKYLRAGCESESKSVGFASPIEPIEPIEPKSNGATTDTRGGRG